MPTEKSYKHTSPTTIDSPRIVFMGTPDFAVASLKALVEGGYPVVGVVTMPDKPVGRHHNVLQASPVKVYAEEQNIPVLQPDKLKAPDFLEALRALRADLQIVVAFRMLPEVVWNMPPLGTFNLHGSLLPQYRGAAPINWAIINGEKETGVTTFFLTHEIDTGKVIDQERIAIEEDDNAGTVHDKLMTLGAQLVVKTVEDIRHQRVTPIPQEQLYQVESELRPAPKLFKETCKIDWNQPTQTVYDFVRGLSPYPAAWTDLQTPSGETLTLKIYEAGKRLEPHALPPGAILSDGKKQLDVATADGFLQLILIQQAGKKRMTAEEFLRGNARIFEGR